ncbi:MAG TPA: hypothetical protein VK926_06985 [Gaiellaceae bacterium]|nr:hypothetical protein [Gaiellaceae bacterium]
MSSELERLLREGRRLLPEPEPRTTARARERARVARRRIRLRSPLVLAVALVVAIGAGIGIGASIAPTGTAAEGPVGFGFLPEHGWYVMQNGADGAPDRPAIAIAANVPIDPADGHAIVPYSPLLRLPPEGVVIVANFTGSVTPIGGALYPTRKPPLQVAEALRGIQWGVQVRPASPLGQFQLRGDLDGHAVDVHFYFGTPRPSAEAVAAAQRQLEQLVVAPKERSSSPLVPARPAEPQQGASRVVDRTFMCSPRFGRVQVAAGPRGGRELVGTLFTSPGYARVSSGPGGDPFADLVVVARPGLRNASTRFPGAVYASAGRCVAARAAVPLTPRGLQGPPLRVPSSEDCALRGRVLVRVRAVLATPARWGRLRGTVGRTYVGAAGRLVEGELAVRDPRTGSPLGYVKLDRRGRIQFWDSPRCS